VDAAAAYERLRDDNDPRLVALGEKIDAIDREIEAARSDVAQASALESDAERAVAAAQEAEAAREAQARRDADARSRSQAARRLRSVAAAVPVARRAGTAPASGSDDQWARLRRCESGGNYAAVSASGRYRGAYQFDVRTWQSVGGTGDPAAAPPAEQDLRARALFDARGSRAWPHCGRHLRH
jgi:peptidoglycan endopeptidase LytE